MSFVEEIVNGVTGNLATDLLKWVGRKIGNAEPVRKIEKRLNPDQLDAATRNLLAEALPEVFTDLQDIDAVGWKPIFEHPENRLQLIDWVLEWQEEIEPDLGAWSLENAPNPELLRGLLLRLHRIIQDKKRKHFSPEFFNLLSKQMEILRNQMRTHEAIGDLVRRFNELIMLLNELLKRPQMDEWKSIRAEIAYCLRHYARWYGNLGSGHLEEKEKAYHALQHCASLLAQAAAQDSSLDRSRVEEAKNLLTGISNTLIDGDILDMQKNPLYMEHLEETMARIIQSRENRQNAERIKNLLGLSQ